MLILSSLLQLTSVFSLFRGGTNGNPLTLYLAPILSHTPTRELSSKSVIGSRFLKR